jgi:hypothetical protein
LIAKETLFQVKHLQFRYYYYLLLHINCTRGFHCDNFTDVYTVLLISSPPTLFIILPYPASSPFSNSVIGFHHIYIYICTHLYICIYVYHPLHLLLILQTVTLLHSCPIIITIIIILGLDSAYEQESVTFSILSETYFAKHVDLQFHP